MSLLVWLPLNRNFRSNGLTNVTVTNNGTTIGDFSCTIDNSAIKYLNVKGNDISGWNEFSVCCWAKPTTTSLKGLFSLCNANNYWHFTFNSTTFDVRDNATGVTGSRKQYNYGTVEANKWIFVCCTYNKGTVKIYKNNVLYSTNATGGSYINQGISTCYIGVGLPTSTSYVYSGQVRDFRIYNHELSTKERTELSRGLFVHYKLDNWETLMSKCTSINWNQKINPNNFPNSGSKNGVTYTSNKAEGSITFNGDCSAYAVIYINHTSVPYTEGHKYIFKGCPPGGFNADNSTIGTYDYRVSYTYNGTKYFSEYGDGYLWTAPNSGTMNVYIRFAKNSHNTNVIFYPKLFDLTLMFGEGNEPTLLDFLTMFPFNYYPYDNGTVKNLVEPITDSTGFENKGTITGTLSLTSNSSRYNKCTHFNTNRITSVDFNMDGTMPFTIMAWVRLTETKSYQPVFWMGNGTTSNGICIHGGLANRLEGGKTSTVTKAFDSTVGSLALNTWKHIAITWDGSNLRRYYNGVLTQTLAWTTDFANTFKRVYLGYFWGGNITGDISDFRLYTSALNIESINDILTLAHIDNIGNMHCYDLIENASIGITKMGILNSSNLIEDNLEGIQASFKKDKSVIINQIKEK